MSTVFEMLTRGLLLLFIVNLRYGQTDVQNSKHQQQQQQQLQQQQHGQHQQNLITTVRTDDPDDGRPLFRPFSQNITVAPGERAGLKCKVDNLGTKSVIWRKQDEVHPLTIGLFPFAADARISVDYNVRSNEWTLIIQDVRPADEGLYHCQISTKDGRENMYTVRLNVKTVQVSGTEYVEKGGMIQLMCNATGRPDPPHNLEWLKDGLKIQSDIQRGVIVTKKIETRLLVSVLVIQNSNMEHAGDYVCQSSEQDVATVTVHVLNVSPPVGKRGTNALRVINEAHTRHSHSTAVTVSLCILSFLFNFHLAIGFSSSTKQYRLLHVPDTR